MYVYIKVKYYLNKRSKGIFGADTRIKRIYQGIVNREYKRISKSLDYQDFVTLTYEIDDISKVDFYYHVSSNPNLKIEEISEFAKNTNYHTKENEVLIFDFSRKSNYIRTDIEGEAR